MEDTMSGTNEKSRRDFLKIAAAMSMAFGE